MPNIYIEFKYQPNDTPTRNQFQSLLSKMGTGISVDSWDNLRLEIDRQTLKQSNIFKGASHNAVL